MKYFDTLPEDQETIINIEYKEQIIKIYSSDPKTIRKLTKSLGKPSMKYIKSKAYWSGASWNVGFFELDKIKEFLVRETFIDKKLKPNVKVEKVRKSANKKKVEKIEPKKIKPKKEIVKKNISTKKEVEKVISKKVVTKKEVVKPENIKKEIPKKDLTEKLILNKVEPKKVKSKKKVSKETKLNFEQIQFQF